MAQSHGDRLTAVDASFLAQEGQHTHMHIGAVMVFEGPPPRFDDFADHVRGRLHLVPRYRQKLAFPPLETGRPLWVDDPNFNLEYHLRHTGLPEPGSEEQLRALAARIHSQRLDRTKPLWELWLVQGLHDGRFALISKTHHAVVDGVAGVDLATVLFDLEPTPPPIPHESEPWMPQPEPSAVEMAARGVRGLAELPFSVAGRTLRAAARPDSSLHAVRESVEGLAEVAWAALNPAPHTPLNVPIGPHRRLVMIRSELSDFKLVKDAFGGTVNDVVLTVVAGGLRRWLHSRGVRTEGLELRALVPVSIRGADERGQMGNRLAVMRGPLPVYVEDPVARLRVVRTAMDGLKESKQAVGAEVLTSVQNLAPADGPRPGVADQLLDAPVQPARDQRAGPAVPAVRARARAARPVPGRLPAARPRARRRDHVLQRRDGLRPARRLRRDARPRRGRRDVRGGARRAGRGGPTPVLERIA